MSRSAVNFAFSTRGSARIQPAIIRAICLPGHQIPLREQGASDRPRPGTGGLQVTMSIIGAKDCLKMTDQGCDGRYRSRWLMLYSDNPSRRGVRTTTRTTAAPSIQTRPPHSRDSASPLDRSWCTKCLNPSRSGAWSRATSRPAACTVTRTMPNLGNYTRT